MNLVQLTVMRNPAVQIASSVLRRFGFEIVRSARQPAGLVVPPLRDSPIEALISHRLGERAAFLCPVDRIMMLNGFGFGSNSWHPFSATLADCLKHGTREYPGSTLHHFYARWQPRAGSDAIAGFHHAPDCLAAAPGYAYHFAPWSVLSLDQEIRQIETYYAADYREHGAADLHLESDGFKFHGPCSDRLGHVEFDRLRRIMEAITHSQYDRRFGDVNVYALRRDGEIRFVCRGGVHRVAAMAAAGHPGVPAQLCSPYLVDLCEIDGWPQVVQGMWERDAAERYFHHLFDFSALAWARSTGFTAA